MEGYKSYNAAVYKGMLAKTYVYAYFHVAFYLFFVEHTSVPFLG